MAQLDATLFVRIGKKELAAFKKKAQETHNDYSSLVRELVTAVNEGRVKITPTDAQLKSKEGLYNVD